jgi:LPS-assembly lipoprotein
VLTRGVAHGVASYDRSNQGFANERGRIEAENRGATSAADEIRLRIAAILSETGR